MTARFEVPVGPGPVEVELRDPMGTRQGRWRFDGGATLVVDLLDPAVCSVVGGTAEFAEVVDGFIAWPRMTLVVDGREQELVASDREVLRRHYSRPHHGAVAYSAPDPAVMAFHKARLAQLRRLLNGAQPPLLDIGSGTSLVLGTGTWPHGVVACDRDPEAMRSLREQGHRVVLGAADEVPFSPGHFATVFAGEIVEHLQDPHAALRQWFSMLRPGGRLIITTPNRTHVMARLLNDEKVRNAEHLFEWSHAELVEAVCRAGGRVMRSDGLHLSVPVYIPGMGWRDVVQGVHRRRPLPEWVLRAVMEMGRGFPTHAINMAVVATPV